MKINRSRGWLLAKVIGLGALWLACSGFIYFVDSRFQLPLSWRQNVGPVVTYRINAASLSAMTVSVAPATCPGQIQAAAQAWSAQAQPPSTFRFAFDASPSNALMRPPQFDCASGVASPQGNVYSSTAIHPSVAGALAVTTSWYCYDHLAQFDLWINPAYSFDCGDAGAASGYDLRSVVTHEFGHALGLDHYVGGAIPPSSCSQPGCPVISDHGNPPCPGDPSGQTATMCYFTNLGDRQGRVLQADDLAGLRLMYPPVSSRSAVLTRPPGLFEARSLVQEYRPVISTAPAPRLITMSYQHHLTGTFIGDQGWQSDPDMPPFNDAAHLDDRFSLEMRLCNSCGFLFPFFLQDSVDWVVRKNGVIVAQRSEIAPPLTGFPEIRTEVVY